jgi:hypothetical protein
MHLRPICLVRIGREGVGRLRVGRANSSALSRVPPTAPRALPHTPPHNTPLQLAPYFPPAFNRSTSTAAEGATPELPLYCLH